MRPGFDRTPAVQHKNMYEIKSSLSLQPGPAALTDGLAELQKIVGRWAGLHSDHVAEELPLRAEDLANHPSMIIHSVLDERLAVPPLSVP